MISYVAMLLKYCLAELLIGSLVYLVGSREATLALEQTFVPVDAAIVGIVDDLEVQV